MRSWEFDFYSRISVWTSSIKITKKTSTKKRVVAIIAVLPLALQSYLWTERYWCKTLNVGEEPHRPLQVFFTCNIRRAPSKPRSTGEMLVGNTQHQWEGANLRRTSILIPYSTKSSLFNNFSKKQTKVSTFH